MALGILVMGFIVFAKPLSALFPVLTPFSTVAWPWYVLIGTTVTVGTGILSSFTHARAA